MREVNLTDTLVELLASYTDPESHVGQCNRHSLRTWTQTDNTIANSRSYCVAVRLAKNGTTKRALNV